MHKKLSKIMLVPLALALIGVMVSACGPKEPTLDINAQKTGFAQTAAVQATMTAEAQPTATFTPEVTPTSTPTETPTGPVETPTTTATAGPSPTTSAPISGNDVAQWRAQDPPDNTEFSPGEVFTVTWTLENTGTSTWTTKYYLEFASGEQMEAKEQAYLPYDVPPSTSVQISVDFKAPQTAGEYKSVWSLVNTNDVAFYTNFYIIINVVE